MKRLLMVLTIGVIVFGCGEAEKEEEKESLPVPVSTARMETKPSIQPTPVETEEMKLKETADRQSKEAKKKTDREKFSEEEVIELISEVQTGLDQQALLEASSGPNPIVLLGRNRDLRAIPVLEEIIIRSEEPLARRQAARVLGMIHDPEAIEALKPALKDEYIWVRLTAALSLARQGEKDEPLTVFSEIITREGADNWKFIMRSVSDGPGGISEEELARREKNLERLKNQTFPILALSGLKAIKTEEALEIVKLALESDNPNVRRKAEKIINK